jgi:hypothetical protein
MQEIAGRTAVVIPGRAYPASAPLLHYAAEAARARGARLRPIVWNPPAELGPDSATDWVCAQVASVLDEVTSGERDVPPLLIGKSLGTHAAVLAAERALPAIWLTPLLIHEPVVAALRAAKQPFLLVGGTADPSWDGKLARELSPHVLEVSDADHGMQVPGPLANSAAVLGRVATAVEEFLDRVVWA